MERVHVDFFEYKGKHVLLMVDAFSKKIWTNLMNTDTTTNKTLAVLYGWFSSESGSPTTLVSDNGPQFTAKDFGDKMKLWGIKHIFSPPYHPASNGAAERAVQLCKDRLKKMNSSAEPWKLHVNLQFICKVHGLTPHTSTDRCPYELIKNAPLPKLFPKLASDVSKNLELTAVRDSAAKLRNRKSFNEGDHVIVYDNHQKLSYKAVVKEILGVNNYIVLCDNGTKHVSGDNLSRAVEPKGDIDKNIIREDEVLNDDTSSVYSDVSAYSDLSDSSDLLPNSNVANNVNNHNFNNNINQPRRGLRELNSLGQVPRLPRLRSGKI